MSFSVTKLIRTYLKANGVHQKHLAKMLEEGESNFSQKLAKNDLDCSMVWEISIALKHDFFADLSKQLPLGVRSSSKEVGLSPIELAIKDFIDKNYQKIK
jgi:hypothetical protein